MKTLKTFIAVAIVSSVCAIQQCGCKSNKIQMIHNDYVTTNTVPVKAFNDENYIWEWWTISTNRVDAVD